MCPPTSAEPSPSIPFPSPLPRPSPRPRSPAPLLSRRRRPAAPPPSTPARSAATSAQAAPIDHAAARVLLLSRDPAIEGLARSSSPPPPPLFDSIVPPSRFPDDAGSSHAQAARTSDRVCLVLPGTLPRPYYPRHQGSSSRYHPPLSLSALSISHALACFFPKGRNYVLLLLLLGVFVCHVRTYLE